jgi:glycosyltransferase involved in cell wall biosynthesis
MAIFSLRSAASFRNQADLLYKAAVHYGHPCEQRDLMERVTYPQDHWDRVLVLGPLWPRYVFDSVRLSAPWVSRNFTLYGPVDGPYLQNETFFKVISNMRVLTTSQACYEWITRSEVRVQGVCPHGIDPQDFKFDASEKYDRLKILRQAHPGRKIFFSNINPLHRKGFDRLAQALEILAQRRPDSYIFILHTGRERALTIHPDLARVPGLIIEDAYGTLPFRAMALKTLSCDVFVWPSKLEGFGLTVLEAMAAGRVIVSTDAPAHNEMISSKEAWLVPIRGVNQERWEGPGCLAQLHEYDASDLAEAMIMAMDHPKEGEEKAERALKRSQDYHYLKVYRALVGG